MTALLGARLALRVALDPIHVDARVSCSTPNADGIRTASIAAATPAWATLRFDRVEQSPELCASPALRAASERRSTSSVPSVVVGVGPLFNARGFLGAGLFVGIGIKLFG